MILNDIVFDENDSMAITKHGSVQGLPRSSDEEARLLAPPKAALPKASLEAFPKSRSPTN